MKFEIWCEGYSATGNTANVTKVWEGEASDFKSALELFGASLSKETREKINLSVNPPTFWGCGLFESEKEARISFG